MYHVACADYRINSQNWTLLGQRICTFVLLIAIAKLTSVGQSVLSWQHSSFPIALPTRVSNQFSELICKVKMFLAVFILYFSKS